MRAAGRGGSPAGLVAVHLRHFHVHEHGVARAGLDRRHGRSAIGRFGDHEASALQRAPHQQPRAGVVVDDQYVDDRGRRSPCQATLLELRGPRSSDSATVRCARSLVTETGSSLRSPLRAECSIWRAMAATLVAPRLALELFSVCARARHALGVTDLHGIVQVGEQLRWSRRGTAR